MIVETRTQAAASFLEGLRREIAEHPAVRHPLLAFLEREGSRKHFLDLGLQHRHLVARFTHYLELLLLRAKDTRDKLWIARVLVDEYGDGSRDEDHASLYTQFLQTLGADDILLASAQRGAGAGEFVQLHEELCGEHHWLVGLGAVGPGHEWSLPAMFQQLVTGLRRLGLRDEQVEYFPLHLEQDIEHGLWLEDALLRHAADPRNQQRIREGAMASLRARCAFWDDCARLLGLEALVAA